MLAKSKLNSLDSLMSQALIDLDISHEEFKTIVNEKEKYEQMKENIVEMHKFKKHFCCFYIKWLKSLKKHGEKTK